MIMIIQLTVLALILIAFCMFYVFKADVEVAFVKGLLLGFSYNDTDYEDENEIDHVAQFAVGLIVLTLTWTESYE